jgi:hypothetical protein
MVLALWRCRPEVDDLLEPLPDAGSCETSLALNAWVASPIGAEDTVEVHGTVRAPAGVTVRSLYVASLRVPRTDFNYRSWQIQLPASELRSSAGRDLATLTVVAFTSSGCAVQVTVPAPGDAGAGDAAAAAFDHLAPL